MQAVPTIYWDFLRIDGGAYFQNRKKEDKQLDISEHPFIDLPLIKTGWNSVPKQPTPRSVTKRTYKTKTRHSEGSYEHEVNSAVPLNDPIHYCESAKLQIIAALPSILQGLIEKAKGGGHQQAKLLLDLCDVTSPDSSQFHHRHQQQLCDALLDGLQFPTGSTNELKSEHDTR